MRRILWFCVLGPGLAILLLGAAQDPSLVLEDGGIQYPDGSVQASAPSVTASDGPVDLYVDAATGDDTNDGLSAASPKKTIQAAIDSVPHVLGGTATINISNGTYRESLLMDRRFMRNSFAQITLLGNEANPSLVTLDGEGTRSNGIIVLGFAEIRGMEIDGFTEEGVSVWSGQLIVEHCRITAAAQEGSLFVFRSEVHLGNTVITNTLGPGITVQQGYVQTSANTEIGAPTGLYVWSSSTFVVRSEEPGSIIIQGNGGAAVKADAHSDVDFGGWSALTIQATVGDAMTAHSHSSVRGYGAGTFGSCSATSHSDCVP